MTKQLRKVLGRDKEEKNCSVLSSMQTKITHFVYLVSFVIVDGLTEIKCDV